jgi:hypothetical protein
MAKIKAQTLSVILPDSNSVHCYLEIDGESCNVTLRFDCGDKATVCGYPMSWGVHDVNVDYYNPESPTYAELVQCDGVIDVPVYVSESVEKAILKKLRASVSRQFRSKDWNKSCPKKRQNQILKMLDNSLN